VAWYGALSRLAQGPILTIQGWADAVGPPVFSALAFGLIGALSPCQLTASLGALAYASAHPGRGWPVALAGAYVAGKVGVSTSVGAAVVLVGLRLDAVAIPVVIVAREVLCPLMIIVALGLLSVWRFRTGIGLRLARRLRERLDRRGVAGAFLLGVAFSFAFCPTLFWLFFGLTVPLALKSAGGWAFPALFALGSSLPLVAVTVAVAAGAAAVEQAAGGLKRIEGPLRVAAAAILVVAGLHDTLVYWLLRGRQPR